ncbi:CAZyme family CE12 [Penicillium herquei]|nr:CAZyme family CE12 [Penicillium herquei]
MKAVSYISLFVPAVLGGTIYLAGDSTMAVGGGGSGTMGWGQFVSQYTTWTVSNQAIAGRSARSFTREGRFTTIADEVQSGDWVIIEFGHNDGGSLTPTDNGRTDCSGTGDETCTTVYDGVNETVLTFPAYLENAANTFTALGANVLISSQTPDNPWETGTFVDDPVRFVAYAELAAETAGVAYVDHWAYVADIYDTLGADAVDAFYPIDHTHTSPAGALVVAQAFFKAVVCGGVALESALNTTTFEGECL